MAEIAKNGPIGCGVCVNEAFEAYKGGIFTDDGSCDVIEHEISIAGYGVDEETGKKYWIGRNSWGEYWGELGYFRLVRGENQLGIEQACSWATPASFTEINYGCYEDGSNCVSHRVVEDPSVRLAKFD